MKWPCVLLLLAGITLLVVVAVTNPSRAAFATNQTTETIAESSPVAGDRKVEEALASAMDWLARHQEPAEGYWDSDGFQERCETAKCGNKGYPLYDPALTGLAALVFLRCGHTPEKGEHGKTVERALSFFKRIQDEEGCFGVQRGHFMYSHAIVTQAVAEAYMRTRSRLLKKPLEKALEFLYMAQNRGEQGRSAWRYAPQTGRNDMSVTSWVVEALDVASHAGCEVPREVREGARRWIDEMTDAKTGRISYDGSSDRSFRAPGRYEKWPPEKTEAMTAKDPVFDKGVDLCVKMLPRWNVNDGSIDMYYWYHATRALALVGGRPWKKWKGALKSAILKNQHGAGCSRGSWDPLGPWGEDGGRVYATTMMALCLAAMK